MLTRVEFPKEQGQKREQTEISQKAHYVLHRTFPAGGTLAASLVQGTNPGILKDSRL